MPATKTMFAMINATHKLSSTAARWDFIVLDTCQTKIHDCCQKSLHGQNSLGPEAQFCPKLSKPAGVSVWGLSSMEWPCDRKGLWPERLCPFSTNTRTQHAHQKAGSRWWRKNCIKHRNVTEKSWALTCSLTTAYHAVELFYWCWKIHRFLLYLSHVGVNCIKCYNF